MTILLVTYIDRSGSTFLVNTLSKSSEVLVCPEAEILWTLFLSKPTEKIKYSHDFLTHIFKDNPKLKQWKFNQTDLEQIIQSKNNLGGFITLLKSYRNKNNASAKVVVFKAQEIILSYPLLKSCSSYNIKFLAIIRDVRGIYASQKFTFHTITRKPMTNNPLTIGKKWHYFIKECLNNKNNTNFFLIQYENMIINYKSEIIELLKKMGIDIHIDFTDPPTFEENLPEYEKVLHPNISKPPILERISNWEGVLLNKEKKILEIICSDQLIKLGYNLKNPNVNVFRHSVYGTLLAINHYSEALYNKFKNLFFNFDRNFGRIRSIKSKIK